jgi:hypothetical protein
VVPVLLSGVRVEVLPDVSAWASEVVGGVTMTCIVLMSVHGGDRHAFNINHYDITIPTKEADEDPVWEELHELAEEWAESANAFSAGDDYTIGVVAENDAGRARLIDNAEVLWCGGYYTMPDEEADAEDHNV